MAINRNKSGMQHNTNIKNNIKNNKYDIHNNKAIYYTLDALLAGFLLVGAVLLMLHQSPQKNTLEQKEFLSQDIVNSLSELKIYELNNSFISSEINNSNITDINKSVLEQAGYYWVLNQSNKSVYLLQLIINDSLPDRQGLSVSIGTDNYILKNYSTKKNLVTSTRMISGIEKGKPLTGSSGSAYLKKISNKKNSVYAYYGGFVGQGNITTLLSLENNINITDMTLEMDVALGSSFKIFINNGQCNDSSGNSQFNATTPNMIIDEWNITNCTKLLNYGTVNNISFNFTNISYAYIQGGYLKVTYTTTQFQENTYDNTDMAYLPGINGVVNLFDSFYIPGDLNNMTIYLHYRINTTGNNNTFYMTVGNTTIYYDNTTSGDNITIKNDTFLKTILDYVQMSNSTVPIRVGFENLTFETIQINGSGFGDVVLTTDVSGSMDENFTTGGSTGINRLCSDPQIYSSSTKKISVARCLDINFTNNILQNTTLNRVGLVSYTTTTDSTKSLTNNAATLNTEINTYVAQDSTCISCGIVDSFYVLTTQLHTDTWRYWQDSQFSSPPTNWSQLSFDDSGWSLGNSSFGYNVSVRNTTLTAYSLNAYANFWEHSGDVSGPPCDFSSGVLNSTANTYGWGAGDDGWDWKAGVYAGDTTSVNVLGLSSISGNYKLRIDIGGSFQSNSQINNTWKYSTNYQFSSPPATWNQLGFDDSAWSIGNSSFGYNVSVRNTTLTAYSLNAYANFWEFKNATINDTPGPPADFSSGVLNSTANTYGWGAGDDGWDWKAGAYGETSVNVSFLNITTYGGNKKLTINITGVASRQDSDGSYGIQFNITQAVYDAISNGGTAVLSIRWNWTGCAQCGSNSDWAAVKARLTNSSGSSVYLGSDSDPGDGSNAVYADNKKPTPAASGLFTQDIASRITGPGVYYLDFGGKLSRDSSTKFGTFYFDDVQLLFNFSNLGNTYYRNTFKIDNTSNISDAVLYVASDDDAVVYLNGNVIDNDTTTHLSSYWNRIVTVSQSRFLNGTNVIAVKLNNDDSVSGFLDMKLEVNYGKISDGSYGIQFNITQAMYDAISNGGTAVLSIRWNWTGCNACSNTKGNDSIWIKARITNTANSTVYLGSNLDLGQDSTSDVFWTNKTNATYGNYSNFDVAPYINGPGIYYIDFGGKFTRNATNKNGTFYFDDVQLLFNFSSFGKTYYRNTFQLINASNMSNPVLYVSSYNDAIVYLNGNLIDNDTTNHSSVYWNRFINVPLSYFQDGNNTLAVQLNNNYSSAFLDLELRANIGKRQNALVIMSDGDANYCVTSWSGSTSVNNCNQCGGRACCVNSTSGQLNAVCPIIGTLDQAAVQFENISCYLHTKYNIGIFSVAFGTGVSSNGAKALNMSASCDNSTHFYTSNNVSGLSNIYQNIASSILSGFLAVDSQSLVFSGGYFAPSILYPDSYISYNYTPNVPPAVAGEIELVFETPKFINCTPQVTIPDNMRVVDAKVVSYSGVHWTDFLSVDGTEVYNLSNYVSNYIRLGDPFSIQIPPNLLTSGKHDLKLKTGDDPTINTNCSTNNSLIYTALVNSSISRSLLLPYKIGCNWTIESEDFVNTTIIESPTSTVSKKCYYTNASISCDGKNCSDSQDSYDYAVFEILRQLDADKNGRIVVTLQQKDLEIVVLLVGGLPYMWGPSMVKVNVWQ